ncbi:MAG: VCBS repeat-containing protein [Caldilineaceae bacterium]|nr:VCBS repeat-containing protein [Caldilineaceae bacterium]
MHKHFRSTTAAAAAPRSTRWIPPASQRLAVVAALVFTAAWLAWPSTARADAPFGAEAPIATNAVGALSVHAADVDGDGDMDALSASRSNHTIAWYENTAGDGSAWTKLLAASLRLPCIYKPEHRQQLRLSQPARGV